MWLRLCLLFAATQLAALHSKFTHQQTPENRIIEINSTVEIVCEIKTFHTNKRTYWLRQLQAPSKDSHYEFLAAWDPAKQTVYGKNVEKEKLTLHQGATQTTLSLKSVELKDSGVYFCMTVGNPELIFGKGTQLTVVNVLPTTAQPTKKSSTKKKKCLFANSVKRKGPPCDPVSLGLLGTGILILLVSLGITIRVYRLRRRARIRFMKHNMTSVHGEMDAGPHALANPRVLRIN